MKRLRVWSLVLVAFAALPCLAAFAQDSSEADFKEAIRKGTSLHDAGDYDGALAIYRALLETHPENATLLYEMSYSSLEKGDNENAIQYARQALENRSTNPAGCYVLIGTAYDAMGKSKEGEKALRDGLKAFPQDQMLHFNLGINLTQQGDWLKGEKELQEGVRLRPEHPGGWLNLAKVEESLGWPGRSFLCYTRFLTLESDSKRSPDPAKRLTSLLFQNVKDDTKPGAEKKEITLAIPETSSGAKKVERSGESLMLAMAATQRYLEDGQKQTDEEFFATAMTSVVAMLLESEEGRKSGEFWNQQVFAYFDEARKEGHLEAMAYDTRRSLKVEEISRWLEEHPEPVRKYQAWTASWKPSGSARK